jgi:iron(III) transport system substrate-binding protein
MRRLAPALACLAAAAPALAQDASLLGYAGADRPEKVLAAAKKEGGFTLYTSFAEKDLPPLAGAFEKKYGIKVRIWRSGSEKVLQRTLAEAAARRYEVDAVHSAAMEMEALHREKLLERVALPYAGDLIAGAVRPHGEWTASYLSIWVQAYNPRLVKKEELPRRFEDLLDPRWKGRLGIESHVWDWYSTVILQMGEDKGLAFFRELVAKNGLSVRSGHTLLNNLVAAGDVPMALTMYNFIAGGAKRKGADVDWIVLEPTIGRMSGIGIMRRAPHPNATLLFYDWLLSPEGQRALVSLDYVPTNARVESPFAKRRFTLVDPAFALDHSDKWEKSFEDVVVKGARR